MRLIHEVYGKFQVGGGFYPYSVSDKNKADGKPLSHGARIELVAEADNLNYDQPWQPENEHIEIEGDLYDVRELLKDWLRHIEISVAMYIQLGQLDPEWESRQVEAKKRTYDNEPTYRCGCRDSR